MHEERSGHREMGLPRMASRVLGAGLAAAILAAIAFHRVALARTWTPWFDIVFRPHHER